MDAVRTPDITPTPSIAVPAAPPPSLVTDTTSACDSTRTASMGPASTSGLTYTRDLLLSLVRNSKALPAPPAPRRLSSFGPILRGGSVVQWGVDEGASSLLAMADELDGEPVSKALPVPVPVLVPPGLGPEPGPDALVESPVPMPPPRDADVPVSMARTSAGSQLSAADVREVVFDCPPSLERAKPIMIRFAHADPFGARARPGSKADGDGQWRDRNRRPSGAGACASEPQSFPSSVGSADSGYGAFSLSAYRPSLGNEHGRLADAHMRAPSPALSDRSDASGRSSISALAARGVNPFAVAWKPRPPGASPPTAPSLASRAASPAPSAASDAEPSLPAPKMRLPSSLPARPNAALPPVFVKREAAALPQPMALPDVAPLGAQWESEHALSGNDKRRRASAMGHGFRPLSLDEVRVAPLEAGRPERLVKLGRGLRAASDHNLLVSELQSLVAETRRRNPEVRDAGDQALELLKAPQPKDVLAEHAETLIAPVISGCRTKNAKIVGISIAALQRLVALGGVPTSKLPEVLQTLNSVANQAVDIQLKILQTLLSILTYCSDIHDEPLGNALLLCFKLQDSRVSVVSSTAAATLRQAVMLIFDRVIAEDPAAASRPLALPTDPPTETVLTPAAMDAFGILSDLCLLTAGGGSSGFWGGGDKEKPRLLKLGSLSRTFGLELIESILGGYEVVVKSHPELLYILQSSLDPLLIRLQAEKSPFPIALRVCRLIYVLIRQYADVLPAQIEVYLVLLIRVGAGDAEGDEGAKREPVVLWMRVLAAEVLRGICSDFNLLQNLWAQYDAAGGPKLFSKLISGLGRLINEKPALLGIGSQMHGLGVPTDVNHNAGYLDMGIDMVTSAASVGVSTVSAMMGTGGGGLGPKSMLKQRLIEQHDKAEAPIIPETYIYLLALQAIDAIAEGIFASSSAPTAATHGLAEAAWPALLAALSYCIGTDLSDSIFAEVLCALQDFTVACGVLDLATPRDAFLSTLGKYAVPPPVVSALQSYLETPSAQRGNSVMGADALGLGAALGVGAPSGPPSLSERNLACLRSLITVAQTLASSLGPAWHDVLETVQNANYLLLSVRRQPARRPTVASPQIVQGSSGRTSGEYPAAKPDVLQDLDSDAIQNAIGALFERSKEMDPEAFTTFVTALCRLSAEMIGLDVNNPLVVDITEGNTPTSPNFSLPFSPPIFGGQRRTSGIHISQSIKSGERSFGLSKLRMVAVLNLSRMITAPPELGWGVVTQHLLAVARHVTAAQAIRLQAAETLAEVLLGSIRVGHEVRVQHQVFDVLVRQVDVYPISATVSVDYDVRASGYATLNQILESSGHSLEVGWKTIFGMLDSVCRTPVRAERSASLASAAGSVTSPGRPPGRPVGFNKGDANLVRIAFPSLTLICTDFLSSLDDGSMRQCIACLGCFGRQDEDVNITLAAIGLLWTVSDAVQRDRKELWLYLLSELLGLGRDPRLEVRSSAMQTLFRCVELYGATLEPKMWEDVLWKIIFPLLDRLSGDESQVLALSSTGSIVAQFLGHIARLASFANIYHHLLERLKRAFTTEPRTCGSVALQALERILGVVGKHRDIAELEPFIEDAWATVVRMGEALESDAVVYTQDNLLVLVRCLSALHGLVAFTEPALLALSQLLRSVMAYARSPEYRPDIDAMAPLQQAVVELVVGSTHLGPSVVLRDLAEFASLAYVSDGARVTYVAVSKWCLPKMGDVLDRLARGSGIDHALWEDGTMESVVGAYVLPIKLKYDCPPASKYGNDPPLWKTAMATFVPVLEVVLPALDGAADVGAERAEGVWAQVMEAFGGVLLADNSGATDEAADEAFSRPILERLDAVIRPRLCAAHVPDRIITAYAETLRRASVLYTHVTRAGSTAGEVEAGLEGTRYWALEALVACAARTSTRTTVAGEADSAEADVDGAPDRLAKAASKAVAARFEAALGAFVQDAKVQGQLPFTRVREDEVLYILRRLATVRLAPGSLEAVKISPGLAELYAHTTHPLLFRLYPLLVAVAFVEPSPTTWLAASEYQALFAAAPSPTGGDGSEDASATNGAGAEPEADARDGETVSDARTEGGDGADELVETSARDLARRCLELVGAEMGLQ
ncbi:Endocytosis and vacuole integrity protein [Cryptotrichosporon argae]